MRTKPNDELQLVTRRPWKRLSQDPHTQFNQGNPSGLGPRSRSAWCGIVYHHVRMQSTQKTYRPFQLKVHLRIHIFVEDRLRRLDSCSEASRVVGQRRSAHAGTCTHALTYWNMRSLRDFFLNGGDHCV